MSKLDGKFIYWAPRILSILFACFLALFSLDIFEIAEGPKEIIIGLFMHNIPTFVLLIVTAIAWKHEWVGMVVFALAGLLYVFFSFFKADISPGMAFMWSLNIAGPAFLIAFLYYLNWKKRKVI